jgi:hypothetical protein
MQYILRSNSHVLSTNRGELNVTYSVRYLVRKYIYLVRTEYSVYSGHKILRGLISVSEHVICTPYIHGNIHHPLVTVQTELHQSTGERCTRLHYLLYHHSRRLGYG